MCFCPCCAIMQMENENQARNYGYDSALSVPGPRKAAGQMNYNPDNWIN